MIRTLLLVVALVGCGGTDGSTNEPPPTPRLVVRGVALRFLGAPAPHYYFPLLTITLSELCLFSCWYHLFPLPHDALTITMCIILPHALRCLLGGGVKPWLFHYACLGAIP